MSRAEKDIRPSPMNPPVDQIPGGRAYFRPDVRDVAIDVELKRRGLPTERIPENLAARTEVYHALYPHSARRSADDLAAMRRFKAEGLK